MISQSRWGCESAPRGRGNVELQTPGCDSSHRELAQVWHTLHPPHSASACRDITTKRSGPYENLHCWPKPEKGLFAFVFFKWTLASEEGLKKMFSQRMGKMVLFACFSWRCWHLTELLHANSGSQSRVGLNNQCSQGACCGFLLCCCHLFL